MGATVADRSAESTQTAPPSDQGVTGRGQGRKSLPRASTPVFRMPTMGSAVDPHLRESIVEKHMFDPDTVFYTLSYATVTGLIMFVLVLGVIWASR